MSDINFTLKGPQSVKVATAHDFLLDGCKIFTVAFEESAVNIGTISFTNRYTGLLTITARFKVSGPNSGESFTFVWKKLLHQKQLMPQPHSATGAESPVKIQASDLLWESNGICAMNIILQQPSVQFKDFGIDNLRILSQAETASVSQELPKWLTEEKSTANLTLPKGGPTVEEVAQLLQTMWSLGQKMVQLGKNANPTPTRFDKDGCYDINLLAYQ